MKSYERNNMHTQCPNCRGSAKEIFTVHDTNQEISNQNFHYYRCNKCRLIFLDPIPDNIQDYYGQVYPAYRKVDNIESQVTDYDLGKIEIVKKYAGGSKLLEIGPGNGVFAYLAQKEGFIVDVIEMDSNCCKFLTETKKIRNVINSDDIARALNMGGERYDVIVLWHVLEHLNDSRNVLMALSNALEPDGVVIIATPNPNALQFKLFKKYWRHVDAPRHVVFFPMQLLIKEMTGIGLEKVLVTTNDKVSSIFNVAGWWLNSLNNYIAGNSHSYVSRILRRRSVALMVYNHLVDRLEKREGCGNAYLAIFKNGKLRAK